MRTMINMALTACAVSAGAVYAGPYDGLYRPDYEWAANWDCQTVGMDGGAIAVREGRFEGVENSCDLTNPVEVRGMQATLYDAVCSGEGMTDEYRVMLVRLPEGLGFVQDGHFSAMRQCE